VPEQYTFPKKTRLIHKEEYTRVFSQGEKAWGKHFICYVLMNTAMETRLGIVASRKVGRAVVRNRVKRLIREFFRHSRHCLPEGMQLIVIARSSVESLNARGCASELAYMLERWMRHA
jgi:ribonuclease P protein component